MPLTRCCLAAAVCAMLAVPGPGQSPTHGPAAGALSGKAQPRRDRYGDPLPEGAIARLGTMRLRPADGPVVFAPDGRSLASAGPAVWDTRTGLRRWQRPGTVTYADVLAYSPDGKVLASADHTGAVRLWSAADGKELGHWQAHRDEVACLGFSADGQALTSAGMDRLVQVWDVGHPGQGLRRVHFSRDRVTAAALSPGGGTLAAADSGGRIHLWDVRAGRERGRLSGHREPDREVRTLAFSPDGKLLVSGDGHVLILWDAARGGEIRHLGEFLCLRITVAFTPDGRRLVTYGELPGWGEPKPLRVWDTGTGRPLPPPAEMFAAVQSLAVSLDGRTLAVAAPPAAIRLVDLKTGKELQPRTGHSGAVTGVAFLPDGRTVVTGSTDGTVRVWDAAAAEQRQQLGSLGANEVTCLALSPDGKTVATGFNGGVVALYGEPAGGRPPSLSCSISQIWGLAYSPDGRLLVCSTGGKHLWYDTRRPERRPEVFHAEAEVTALAAAADRGVLAVGVSGDSAGSVELWDMRRRTLLRRVHVADDRAAALAVAPDGQTVAAGDGAEAFSLWDVNTARLRWRGRARRVRCLTFSPDGRTLAVAGDSPDPSVRLWEVATGRERASFRGQAGVGALAFRSDGRLLASGGEDTTAIVWDVAGDTVRGQTAGRKPARPSLAMLWADLADCDGPPAYRAVWALTGRGEEAVRWVTNHVQPAAADPGGRAGVRLRDLDHRSFAEREKATAALARLGDEAEPALRQALARRPSPEARRRLEGLLDRLSGPVSTPAVCRGVRAVEVLEHIATPAARQQLQRLAGGAPGAQLTREAKAALDRLEKRSADKR